MNHLLRLLILLLINIYSISFNVIQFHHLFQIEFDIFTIINQLIPRERF